MKPKVILNLFQDLDDISSYRLRLRFKPMADGTARGTTVLTDDEGDGFMPMFAFFDAVKKAFIDWCGSVKSSGNKVFS